MSGKRLPLARADDDGPGAGETVTLVDSAYTQMRRDIIGGVFAPGQPLRLELLRSMYGFSFSPLREALNRLQSDRLVTSIALRGFTVAPISIGEMWDAVGLRILIECEALRRSIRNGGDSWEGQIVATYHALSLKVRRIETRELGISLDEIQEIESSHQAFHHSLIAVCRSARLLDVADKLYAETERYRQPMLLGAASVEPVRDVAAEHQEIMEAVLARDEHRAVGLLTAHYERTANTVERRLVKNP